MNYRLVLVFAILVAAVFAAADGAEKEITEKDKLTVAKAVAGSLGRVEYTLKFDKGDAPSGAGRSGRYYAGGLTNYIDQERPYEQPAFVLSPTQVVTLDTMIHPRFIRNIAVRFGEELVAGPGRRPTPSTSTP